MSNRRRVKGRSTPARVVEALDDDDFAPALAPTSVKMAKRTMQGVRVVTVRFRQPNIQFDQTLTYGDWLSFCDDIRGLIEGAELLPEEVRTGGLVIPSAQDVGRLTQDKAGQ